MFDIAQITRNERYTMLQSQEAQIKKLKEEIIFLHQLLASEKLMKEQAVARLDIANSIGNTASKELADLRHKLSKIGICWWLL